MGERLLDRDAGELARSAPAERPTAGRQHDPRHLAVVLIVRPRTQALVEKDPKKQQELIREGTTLGEKANEMRKARAGN